MNPTKHAPTDADTIKPEEAKQALSVSSKATAGPYHHPKGELLIYTRSVNRPITHENDVEFLTHAANIHDRAMRTIIRLWEANRIHQESIRRLEARLQQQADRIDALRRELRHLTPTLDPNQRII